MKKVCKKLIEYGFEITGSDYSGEVYKKNIDDNKSIIIFFDYVSGDVTCIHRVKGKDFPANIPYYLINIINKRCKEIDGKETVYLKRISRQN